MLCLDKGWGLDKGLNWAEKATNTKKRSDFQHLSMSRWVQAEAWRLRQWLEKAQNNLCHTYNPASLVWIRSWILLKVYSNHSLIHLLHIVTDIYPMCVENKCCLYHYSQKKLFFKLNFLSIFSEPEEHKRNGRKPDQRLFILESWVFSLSKCVLKKIWSSAQLYKQVNLFGSILWGCMISLPRLVPLPRALKFPSMKTQAIILKYAGFYRMR